MSIKINGETVTFWNLNSFEEAEKLAERARVAHPGKPFLAFDYGSGVSPRFGVCEPPQLGDAVSYAFNGDSYPCGHVEKIGKDYKRVMADGVWYYRRKLSPNWRKAGGTWSLISGHHNERNPSF